MTSRMKSVRALRIRRTSAKTSARKFEEISGCRQSLAEGIISYSRIGGVFLLQVGGARFEGFSSELSEGKNMKISACERSAIKATVRYYRRLILHPHLRAYFAWHYKVLRNKNLKISWENLVAMQGTRKTNNCRMKPWIFMGFYC